MAEQGQSGGVSGTMRSDERKNKNVSENPNLILKIISDLYLYFIPREVDRTSRPLKKTVLTGDLNERF